MKPEPHLEFIPFPEPARDPEPGPEPGPEPAVAPDQVLSPDEPVVLLAEGESAPVEPLVEAGAGEGGAEVGVDKAFDDEPPHAPTAEVAEVAEVIDVRSADSDDGAEPEAAVPPAAQVRAEPVTAARRPDGAVLGDPIPEPEAPADTDLRGLRRWGIAGRLLLVPMAAIVLAVLLALVAIWGLSSATGDAGDLSAATRAASEASELRILLARVSQDPASMDPETIQELQARGPAVAALADDLIDRARADDLARAVDRVVEVSRDGAGDLEVESRAIEATSAVDQVSKRIEASRSDRLDSIEQTRTLTVLALLVLLLAGSLVLLLLGRAVTQSMVVPLRALGRTMRRFADGDTSARGTEGVDEVGLLARSFNYSAGAMGQRIDRLSADAARGAQLRMISDALDLADDESDVHRITERALAIVVPDHPSELLLHESTSTQLAEVAVHPHLGSPGCPVETSSGCVAMRRAQAVVFESPSAINACPHLRGRETPCAASCVPVSVNGHLLGVVHVTGPDHQPPGPEKVEQLVTLAGQVGNRIGAMRTLEVTRLQASTDGLTGLANRRMLEARLADFMRTDTPFVLAVADLDHFTRINNTYGHEFGDRALQLFASVLEDNVRDRDVVARFGGEEFVLVYPEMSVKPSMEAIERVRAALARAIARNDFPEFTCSFGVTHSSVGDSVESIIRVADAGLLTAKELGRNRVVYADEDMAAEVFGSNEGLAAARTFSSTAAQDPHPTGPEDPPLGEDSGHGPGPEGSTPPGPG